MEEVKGYDDKAFRVGDRVELHPATDFWMRGARFATVAGIGLTLQDQVKVRLDKLSGRLFSGPASLFKKI